MSQPNNEITKEVVSVGREKSAFVGRGKDPVLLRAYYKGPIPDHCLRARQTYITEYYKFKNDDNDRVCYTIEFDPDTGREILRID